MAVDRGDAIGLEQASNATGQLLNDTSLALHHLGNVDFHVLGQDAHRVVIVAGFLKLVSHFQQGLGRDTAYVQAGTTEHLALAVFTSPGLNTGGLKTQLSGFNGSNVTTGACTNDNNVELIGHNLSCYRIR